MGIEKSKNLERSNANEAVLERARSLHDRFNDIIRDVSEAQFYTDEAGASIAQYDTDKIEKSLANVRERAYALVDDYMEFLTENPEGTHSGSTRYDAMVKWVRNDAFRDMSASFFRAQMLIDSLKKTK
jgi:hypothetical protein